MQCARAAQSRARRIRHSGREATARRRRWLCGVSREDHLGASASWLSRCWPCGLWRLWNNLLGRASSTSSCWRLNHELLVRRRVEKAIRRPKPWGRCRDPTVFSPVCSGCSSLVKIETTRFEAEPQFFFPVSVVISRISRRSQKRADVRIQRPRTSPHVAASAVCNVGNGRGL